MDADACRVNGPAPHRLSGTVAWLLGRASLRAHQTIQERLADHGIRKWHYAVLAALAEFGPSTQAQIGRRLSVDRSDIVAILNDLERDDYVRRAPDPSDRRRNIVTMTPVGRDALRRFDEVVIRTDHELLGSLTPDERTHLTRLLERLVIAPDTPSDGRKKDGTPKI